MIFDNYTGKQYMMGVAKRIFWLGVIVGFLLFGGVYLLAKWIF